MSAEQIDAEKLERELKIASAAWSDEARECLIFKAARAHLSTLPRVKEVEVWHVEYAEASPDGWFPEVETFIHEIDANDHANRLREVSPAYDCITVTGPHKQKVPA